MLINTVKTLFSLIAACISIGCIHMVKTDMDNYLQNKDAFRGKSVVFTTELEDVLKRCEIFKDREVELSAPVAYFGKEGFDTFYLTLEKNGKQIRAYEEHYYRYVNADALQLLLWAKSEGGEVTVRGKLKDDGIELNQLGYKEYLVNTNRRPHSYRPSYRPFNRDYSGYYSGFSKWNFNHSYNYRSGY